MLGAGPVPGKRFPVEKHHEVGQVAVIHAVATDAAHEVHAHGVAAERKEQAVAEAQNAAVAPHEIERQRRDGVAHDLADKRHGVSRQVQRMRGRQHQRTHRHDHHHRQHERE